MLKHKNDGYTIAKVFIKNSRFFKFNTIKAKKRRVGMDDMNREPW